MGEWGPTKKIDSKERHNPCQGCECCEAQDDSILCVACEHEIDDELRERKKNKDRHKIWELQKG